MHITRFTDIPQPFTTTHNEIHLQTTITHPYSPFPGKVVGHSQFGADDDVVKVNVMIHRPQFKAYGIDGEEIVKRMVILKEGRVGDPLWFPDTLKGGGRRHTDICQKLRNVSE